MNQKNFGTETALWLVLFEWLSTLHALGNYLVRFMLHYGHKRPRDVRHSRRLSLWQFVRFYDGTTSGLCWLSARSSASHCR